MTDIYRAVSNVVTGPRPRREQPWVQATPSIMRDICRAVSNVVTGPLPTISIKRPGNPIYELLYEFKLHCHLLGNLSIRSSPFWQQWFQISSNSKPDICLWKITNSLAILRLRKPLKTSTRLAGHGIWTRDLPNASLLRYHGATSLGYSDLTITNLYIYKRRYWLTDWLTDWQTDDHRRAKTTGAKNVKFGM